MNKLLMEIKKFQLHFIEKRVALKTKNAPSYLDHKNQLMVKNKKKIKMLFISSFLHT